MRADAFAGQLIQALSRRTPAFQPGPGKIGSFGHEIVTALGRSGPAFLPQQEPDTSRLPKAAEVSAPMTQEAILAALRDGESLVGANLSRAKLSGVILSDTDLSLASLSDADLRGANLSGAILSDVDLRDADVRDANLRGTDLRRADLRGADLRGADLGGARWNSRTSWPKAEFMKATASSTQRKDTLADEELAPWLMTRDPVLNVRVALGLLMAIVVGLVAGGLVYLVEPDVPTAVLVGGAAAGIVRLFDILLDR